MRHFSLFVLLYCTLNFSLLLSVSFAQEIGLDDVQSVPIYRAQLGFDGNRSTGNFDQRRMSSRGTLLARYDDVVAVVNQHRYSYMKNGDLKFSDDFRNFTVVNFRPLQRFSPYLIGLYHNSFTRFIDRRWMTGLGGAFSFLRSKRHQFKVGFSGSYEWTRLDGRAPPFIPSDGYGDGCLYRSAPNAPRSCDRQMWRLIPRLVGHHEWSEGRLIFDYEALWVVDPFNPDDERVFMGVTLATPITSWLRLYAHYDFSFESIVLKHREQLDSHLTFGFKLNYLAKQ